MPPPGGMAGIGVSFLGFSATIASVVTASLVIECQHLDPRRREAAFSHCGLFPIRDVKIEMITAAEYRAWAEESLEFARNAANENSREAYIKFAEIWLESALRAERLAALLERPSKDPIPTTDYEWVLPPFQEWRRVGTSLK
jgi:hypothetical protein